MPRFNCVAVAVVALALVVAPSCGGGGHGFGVPSSPLSFTTTVLPALLSGDTVDVELELTGGCGGPYVVEVISGGVNGGLPPGLGVENRVVPDAGPDGILGNADDTTRNAAFLTGTLLADGVFDFTIQVTDKNCTPFLSQTIHYAWSVGVGQVRIVGADPAFVPEAQFNDPNKHEAATNPGTSDPIDALPTTVYNNFSTINLTVAGGVPPYSCAVIDDPNDPRDGGLPLGMIVPVSSCSIVGAPVEVLAGGIPFLFTFRVTDSTGASSVRKFQWKIDTPPIIVATTDLPDGKAGQPYGEPIQTADGVPPFSHELMDTAGEEDGELHVNNSPGVPTFPTTPGVTVNTNGASNNKIDATDYAAPAAMGPYDPAPSEGMYLIDTGAASGQFTGIPRRVGNFTIHFHVYSQLVPNERGQHGFKTFNFDIAQSELPTPAGAAFSMLGSFTTEGVLITSTPFSTLPEFEKDVVYNPDLGTHAPSGLQLLAEGGVAFDGRTDGPHSSQVSFSNPQEPVGGYRWEIADWNPVSGKPDPAGIDLFAGPALAPYSTGVLGTTDETLLVRAGRQLVSMRIIDEQLPTSLRNERLNSFGYSIGPDKVIITESTTSVTSTTTSSTGQYNMHDQSKVVRKFEVVSGLGTINDLDASDITATHVLPATVVGGQGVSANDAIDELLSGTTLGNPNLGLVRISVNPTGWWDDLHGLNANAARPFQHGDPNKSRSWTAPGYRSDGGWQVNVAALDLPDATGIAHAPASGVFADGGRMHAFETTGTIGFFIIRADASIYVPFAIEKGIGYESFGDGMFTARANGTNSALRSLQISVSPDGRWAACEIQQDNASSNQHLNPAANSQIVIFSLCGEKAFNGGTETYTRINTIPAGVTRGNFMYAPSMALTNHSVYYLLGEESGSNASWRDHYVCRYDILGGAAAGELVPGITGQSATQPVQTPFHKWDTSVTSNISTFTSGPPSGFISLTVTSDESFLYDGARFLENTQAPMPFRVSRNGNACAILAGPSVGTSTTSGTDVMRHHLYVDYDGAASAHQATTSTAFQYAPNGGSRGTALSRGPNSYRHWGKYAGPTTNFEISDDGMRAAFSGFSGSRSVSSQSSTSNWLTNTAEVFAFSATGGAGDPWTTVSQAGTDGNLTGDVFAGSQNWRFGSLGFTADNNALFFWAGCSENNMTSTSSTAVASYYFEGSYYMYDFTNATKSIKSMLARTNGGSLDGIKTYTVASKLNLTNVTAWSGSTGYIMPIGGFYGKNRNFFYVSDLTPHTASNDPGMLLGFNVSGFSGNDGSGGPHATRGEGFVVDSYPSRRPFVRQYYYQPHFALDTRYYAPGQHLGGGNQVMAKDTGWVFWANAYARSGTSQTKTTSFGTASGPALPTYWSAYQSGGEVWGFNAEVAGPATELTHAGLGGDSSTRMIHFLEVNNAGSMLSFVYDDTGSTVGHDDERVGHIYGIDFDATSGAMNASFDRAVNSRILETSDGRAGEAMSHDSTGTRLYYAYKSGSGGNEKEKGLVMALRDASGTITLSRFFNSGTARKWYDVLYSGR